MCRPFFLVLLDLKTGALMKKNSKLPEKAPPLERLEVNMTFGPGLYAFDLGWPFDNERSSQLEGYSCSVDFNYDAENKVMYVSSHHPVGEFDAGLFRLSIQKARMSVDYGSTGKPVSIEITGTVTLPGLSDFVVDMEALKDAEED
ncbi:hypothetical protein FMN63_24950 [Stappia sp. BW2]|uniref:hypothetical protein n=1 Tax=Stappia sp. BW2 TaxID=2592622 RepID=UPI0011DE9977|nr:hypothetical protein [Stappia sp. BW2]TYC65634.1 hypothetical protein FMN63_24950 [Stappia sp. BW2]